MRQLVFTLEQKALEQKALEQIALEQKAHEQRALEQEALEQKALEQISKLQSKVCLKKCPIMCSNICRLLLIGNRIIMNHMLM